MGTKGEIMGYVADYLDKAEEVHLLNSRINELELELDKARKPNEFVEPNEWSQTTLVHKGMEFRIATNGEMFRIISLEHQFLEVQLIIDNNHITKIKAFRNNLNWNNGFGQRLQCEKCGAKQPNKIKCTMPNGDIYVYKGCCENQYLYSINGAIQPMEFNGSPINGDFLSEDEMEL